MGKLYTKRCKYLGWSVTESCRCKRSLGLCVSSGCLLGSAVKSVLNTTVACRSCLFKPFQRLCDEQGIVKCVLIVPSEDKLHTVAPVNFAGRRQVISKQARLLSVSWLRRYCHAWLAQSFGHLLNTSIYGL